ncbi:MAG: hypothetical protein GC139_08345 [Sideroxydans sp.]|nr:hypothetical protein [Sideroxydans sp.]
MKANKTAIAAILLWLVTIAVFAWFFVRGNTAAGSDNRTAVVLAPGERSLILSEMRGLLAGVHGILDGINHNDMKQVADAARAVGMASAADVNPALMAKLPLAFKQLGMSVHRDMDDLAQAAAQGRPAAELQGMLASSMSKCVACHASWQLKSGE